MFENILADKRKGGKRNEKMWEYEKYLKRREDLIQEGISFPEASEQAHREVSEIDQMSYKDR